MRYFYFSFLFFVITTAFSQEKTKAPEKIPDFGSLNDYFGKDELAYKTLPKKGKLMFVFYDPECGHCQQLGHEINKNIELFEDTQIYFVSMQEKVLVEKYIDTFLPKLKKRKNIGYYHDEEYAFLLKFNPQNFPSLYLYEAKDKRLLTFLDGENKIDDLRQFYNGKGR